MISSAYLKHDAYIDGEWIAAASGKSFAVYNPADGTEIASVADCRGRQGFWLLVSAHCRCACRKAYGMACLDARS